MSDNGENYNILADETWEYPEEPVYPGPYDMTIYDHCEFSHEPDIPDPYHYPSVWSLFVNCQVTNNNYLDWIKHGPVTVFGRKIASQRSADDIKRFLSLLIYGYIKDATRGFIVNVPEALKRIVDRYVPTPPPMTYQIRIFVEFPPKMGTWMEAFEGEYENVPRTWKRKHLIIERMELIERLGEQRREAARFRKAIRKCNPY